MTAGWLILRGTTAPDPLASTYAFSKDVMGFDLAEFLEKNQERLRLETEKILSQVLKP